MNLLIKNALLVANNRTVKRDILIKNGIIKKIAKSIKSKTKSIDANNNYIIPGVIDPHVHCREPGATHKEDFYTASKAAASAGITTMMDMPNTSPPTFTIKDLKNKINLAKKSIINTYFHFGSDGKNIDEIKKATTHPKVKSTKIFLNHTTGNLLIKNKKDIENIFKASKLILIHAEKAQLKTVLKLSIKHKTPLYVCHISSKADLEAVKKAKLRFSKIYAELTPHHLFLTKEDVKKQGNFALMKPELKTKTDQKSLWKNMDIIDTIGTDHAPHTKKEKKQPIFGVPGLETMLPLLLNEVNKNKLTLTQVVKLTSTNAAKIFNLNKGKIKPGYDADLTIIDLKKEKYVNNKDLKTKCKWSPFHKRKLKGWPIITILKGKIIWRDNND